VRGEDRDQAKQGLVSGGTTDGDPRPHEPIAIVGIGCRLPGGVRDPESYWDLLRRGEDAIVDVPADRWDLRAYFHSDPGQPAKMYTRQAGFLRDGIHGFDTTFFRMSPREASRLDPQQRLLMEVAWEAFEDAGIDPARWAGAKVGVYIGGFTADSMLTQASPSRYDAIGVNTATGVGFTMLAARLSYTFDLRGPSFTLDTACSSSLVALHQACAALWNGDCVAALAGGVNAMFHPGFTIVMCKGGFLSPDARCKAFDARANGYARGEGAGVLALKPLSRALADGDPIHATIVATAVNQDGYSAAGITVPSEEAQRDLLRVVYGRAGVANDDVAYVEAHGTGTPVGDPIEARALGAVLGVGRRDGPLLLGSVKTNIGHLEAASGVAGVIKTALTLERRRVPRHLHFETPNPAIDFAALGIRVAAEEQAIVSRGDGPVYAGVNSFGYGGTNAHVVLASAPPRAPEAKLEEGPAVVPLSARSGEALAALARRWIDEPTLREEPLRSLAFNAACRRGHHDHRAAIAAASTAELMEALAALAAGERDPRVAQATSTASPRVAFVYTGMGPQWWGMGRELYETEPVFRESLERCDAEFRRAFGISVIEELGRGEAESRVARTEIAQIANFALQTALTALWASWGVKPDVIVGHSVGEVSAAYVSGALSLPDAVAVSHHRGRLQATTAGDGGMLATGLSEAEARELLAAHGFAADVAAINSPRSVTLAGARVELAKIAEALTARGVFARALHVDVAYHSRRMDPICAPLLDALAGVVAAAPRLPLYSTVMAARVLGADLDAAYWWRNVREAVRFSDAVETLVREAEPTVFLEVGPHPVLSTSLREILRAGGPAELPVLPSLHRERPERATMHGSLAELYVRGAPVAWRGLLGASAPHVRLPRYPFQRERLDGDVALAEADAALHAALPGAPIQAPEPTWERELNARYFPWLPDHGVADSTVFPAAGYVAAALSAARAVWGEAANVLEDVELHAALLLDGRAAVLRTSIDPATRRFSIHARHGLDRRAAWALHASGRVVLEAPAATARALPAPHAGEVALDAAEIYRALAATGFRYGPSFRLARAVRVGGAEISATLDSPPPSDPRLPIEPTALDAAFHALLAGVLAGQPAEGGGALMPVGFERIAVWASPRGALEVRASVRARTAHDLTADLEIADAARPQVEVRGLRCVAVGAPVAAPPEHLYACTWAEAQREIAGPAAAGGRWLIVGDAGAELAARLEGRGAACRVVRAGGAALREALRAESPAGYRGVVDVTGLAPVGPGADAAGAVSYAARLLATLQQIVRTRWEAPPRVWVVTRAAQPAGGVAVVPTRAPAWGLARVLANESPELRCSLCDLDPEAGVERDLEALVEELLADGPETEVALRAGDRRFVARLERVPRERAGAASRPVADRCLRLEKVGPESALLRAADELPCSPDDAVLRVSTATLAAAALASSRVDQLIACIGRVVTADDLGARMLAVVQGRPATRVVVPASALVTVPGDVPDALLAQAPGVAAALAGWERARPALGTGARVVVFGASTAAGSVIAQLARAEGAVVVGVGESEDAAEPLRALGAGFVRADAADLGGALRRGLGGGADALFIAAPSERAKAAAGALDHGGRVVFLIDEVAPETWEPLWRARRLSLDRIELSGPGVRPGQREAWVRRAVEAIVAGRVQLALGTTVTPADCEAQTSALAVRAAEAPFALDLGADTLTALPSLRAPRLVADATYLVLGGLGGFGLATARWLLDRGARHLVLASRRGAPGPDAEELLAAARAAGATVVCAAADAGVEDDVRRLLARIRAEMPPLRGVVHAAAVYDDDSFARLDDERLARVMAPKVVGATVIHEITRDAPLDFFVAHSSASSVFGFVGQASYAAANAYLDALAEHRQGLGLPALSVNWGALEAGLVARDEAVARGLRRQGASGQPVAEALATLGVLLGSGLARSLPAILDWARWARVYGYAATVPRFSRCVVPVGHEPGASGERPIHERLEQAAASSRLALVVDALRAGVASTLGMRPERVDPDRGLDAVALDSLTAVELKSRVDRDFGISLPVLRLLDKGSLVALAEVVLAAWEAARGAPSPGREQRGGAS
jgi:acyl transferase domain-containing protein/acyl carrier protein